MSCREEFIINENDVVEEHLLREMRLARIADVWLYRRTVKYNKWVTEYNRRVEELNKEADQRQDFDEKYLIPWIEELEALDDELGDLLDRWEAGEDVTPADWAVLTAGKERKAIHVVHHDVPKESWPLPVRDKFPNLIALLKYDWEERLEDRRQKIYAQIVKNIADSSIDAKASDYKEQYRKIVKHFAEQGAVTMELAGDTSDGVGWQTPITAEQIERLREQLNMDLQLFKCDVVAMLLDHLHYEDVMNQDFDAYAWVRKIFQDQALSPGEPLQRAAQMVHAWVKYWQTQSGGEADGVDEKALDKNINYENAMFVPVEPVLDQFGMDLDDETGHTE
ncbi:hypothetical protein E8E11_001790 [Didymella keratinophila]|nr:hypothetical protein E8E11_001790 [Didymella keratinophila]